VNKENLSEEIEKLIEEKVERRVKKELSEQNNKKGGKEPRSDDLSRRGFLKKLGVGAIGFGALGLSPVSSLRLTKNGFSGSGTVDVKDSDLNVRGNPVWHQGNDGSGSGLDADTLDGAGSSGLIEASTTDDGSDVTTYQNSDSSKADNDALTICNISGSGTVVGGFGRIGTTSTNDDGQIEITVDGGTTFTVPMFTSGGTVVMGHVPNVEFESSLKVVVNGTGTGNTSKGIDGQVIVIE